MTAEIVNLRKARKAKARQENERAADRNRAAFGRTKGQKLVEELDKARARKALDGAEREVDSANTSNASNPDE